MGSLTAVPLGFPALAVGVIQMARVTKRQRHAQMLAAFKGARTQAGAEGSLLAGDTKVTILHDGL